MTSKKNGRTIPREWEWHSGGRHTGYWRRDGIAMNRCQWLKPVVWTITTNEEKQTAIIRCNLTYYVNNDDRYPHVSAILTIVGDALTVEEGPWQVEPRRGETPALAGIRWVEQQENAARQLGSK